MRGESLSVSESRYTFEYPGAVQGFLKCEFDHGAAADVRIFNRNEISGENGLCIECCHVADGVTANVSTQTFIDFSKLAVNFSTVASPTLYSSQVVSTTAYRESGGQVYLRPYILYYDIDDQIQVIYGDGWELSEDAETYFWTVPDTKGMSICKLGYQMESRKRFDGRIVLKEIDWNGAPADFSQRGMLMNSIWNTNPLWLAGFASSAAQFAADFKRTYCVSHAEANGVVTIGSREWKDYSVESTIYYSLHQEGGLVARSTGHRRFYAAVLNGFSKAQIILEKDGKRTVLGETEYPYEEETGYCMKLTVKGSRLYLDINGKRVLEAEDATFGCGGGGFLISKGTMTCDSLIVKNDQQGLR